MNPLPAPVLADNVLFVAIYLGILLGGCALLWLLFAWQTGDLAKAGRVVVRWCRRWLPREASDRRPMPYVMGHHAIHVPSVKPLDRSNFEASYGSTVIPFAASRRAVRS